VKVTTRRSSSTIVAASISALTADAELDDLVALAAMPLVLYPDDQDEHGIPLSVHYRLAEACVSCFYFKPGGDFDGDGDVDGYCKMFDVGVEPEYICDEWTTSPPDDA
jgi:hypothetical protein